LIKGIKIPKERIAVLIGSHGEVKKRIEKYCKVEIEINEEIILKGEAIDVMNAENIVKAIGRGFNPDDAFRLLDENNTLCVIPLPGNKRNRARIKARVIGTNGSAKRKLEDMTNCIISVYGKTISIIGDYDSVLLCKEAIEKFISGSKHKNVYQFIKNKKFSVI